MIFKLKRYYNNIPEFVKASIAFIVCNVFVRGISFITLPIFTRLLTTAEYGQLTIYSSWGEILALFGTLTIWGGIFNMGLMQNDDRKESYVSETMGLGIVISGIFAIVGILLSPFLSTILKLNQLLTVCIFIHIIALIPYNVWMSAKRFEYKYKSVVCVTLLSSILNPTLGYLLIISANTYKVEARIIGGLLVEFIIGVILLLKIELSGKSFYNKSTWKFLFFGNIILIPHYLSMQLLSHSDRLMIGFICGDDETGVYGIAYTFAMLLSLVGTGVEASVNPYIFKSLKNRKTDKIKGIGTFVAVLMSVMCILLICFIPEVFHFMLPEAYYESIWCIPPVAIGAYYMFMSFLFSCIEFYYGETKYVAIVSCVFAAINVALNWFFIHLFGYIAAAYTTFVCYFGIFVAHYYLMEYIQRKNNDISKLYDSKNIFLISGIFTLVALLITVFYDYGVIRYLLFIALLMNALIKKKYIAQMLENIFRKGDI